MFESELHSKRFRTGLTLFRRYNQNHAIKT